MAMFIESQVWSLKTTRRREKMLTRMELSFGNILIELQILTDISKMTFLYLTITTNKYFSLRYLVSAPRCYTGTKIIILTDASTVFPCRYE